MAVGEGQSACTENQAGIDERHHYGAVGSLREVEAAFDELAADVQIEISAADLDSAVSDGQCYFGRDGWVGNDRDRSVGTRGVDCYRYRTGECHAGHADQFDVAEHQHEPGAVGFGARLDDGECGIGQLQADCQWVDLGGADAVGVFEEERAVAYEHGDVGAGQAAAAECQVGFDADEVGDDQIDTGTEDIDEWHAGAVGDLAAVRIARCRVVEPDLDLFATDGDSLVDTFTAGIDAHAHAAASAEWPGLDSDVARQDPGQSEYIEDEDTVAVRDLKGRVGVVGRIRIDLHRDVREGHDGDARTRSALLLEGEITGQLDVRRSAQCCALDVDANEWSGVHRDGNVLAFDSHRLIECHRSGVDRNTDCIEDERESGDVAAEGGRDVESTRDAQVGQDQEAVAVRHHEQVFATSGDGDLQVADDNSYDFGALVIFETLEDEVSCEILTGGGDRGVGYFETHRW